MTIAAERLGAGNRGDSVRWSVRWVGSLAVVLALHAVLAYYAMTRQVGIEPAGQPPSAVMIDLAPIPAPSVAQPPPPEPVIERKVEPPPEPLPIPPEPSPAPKPVVTVPVKPVHHPKPRPVQPPPPPPMPAAPTVTAPPAPAAAPAPSANAGAARASWQSQLVGWLERYKRYPRLAREQRQEGVAYLRFAIDRQGHVLSAQIEKSSGSSLLDEEVLALIQRAQPLPAPPAEIPGAHIELVVPVRFSLSQGGR